MLKQVTIECEVPDGYEAVRYGPPRHNESYLFDGGVEEAPHDFKTKRCLIVRRVDPIPLGVFWLEVPLVVDGLRTTISFITGGGKVLHRQDFDYDKWMPRRDEFPRYAPQMKIGPIGPEDVIAGMTIIKCPTWTSGNGGTAILSVHPERVAFVCSYGGEYVIEKITYEDLRSGNFTYSNDHGKTWKKCEKEAK